MKFKSPTADQVPLGLTSGHTFVIGPQLIEVPAMFHRQAVSEGCIPEGMESLPADDAPAETKQTLLITAIKKMIDNPSEGDFNNDGKVDVRKLSAQVGFTVLASERDEAWMIVADEE